MPPILFAVVIFIGCLLFASLMRYAMQQTAQLRAAWQRFADETGGKIEKGRLGVLKIVVSTAKYPVSIDTYSVSAGESSVTYTRILVPYSPTRPFYFRIQPRAHMPKFMVNLGAKAMERIVAQMPEDKRAAFELTVRGDEIPFGDTDLDARYLLRATDPELARRIFSQPSLLRLLALHKDCILSLQPPDMDKALANTEPVLGFQQSGILSTSESLRNAYDLVSAIIVEMERLGLAAPQSVIAANDSQQRV